MELRATAVCDPALAELDWSGRPNQAGMFTELTTSLQGTVLASSMASTSDSQHHWDFFGTPLAAMAKGSLFLTAVVFNGQEVRKGRDFR